MIGARPTNSQPAISVVIPTFNYARYLPDAVRSAEEQSLPPKEIIVIDDGSTDETAEVARDLAGRIRYVRTSNQGVSAARNLGAQESNGDLLAFLDADDIWAPEKLLRQLAGWEASLATGARAIQCGFAVVNQDLLPSGHVVGVSELSRRSAVLLRPQFTLLSSTLLIDRETFLALDGFDTRLSTSADFEFGLRLCTRGLLTSIPDPLVLYRAHGHQMHRNPSAFHTEMSGILRRELGNESFLTRRRSLASMNIMEARLWALEDSPFRAATALTRAISNWPPSLAAEMHRAIRSRLLTRSTQAR